MTILCRRYGPMDGYARAGDAENNLNSRKGGDERPSTSLLDVAFYR